MSSLLELTAAVANQLSTVLVPEVPELQVTPLRNDNPTPPAIDLYPAAVFQEQIAYGDGEWESFWVVRARVTTTDSDYGQTLLLQLLDPHSPLSVVAALRSDRSFDGTAQDSTVEAPTGYAEYTDPGGQGQLLVGCEWRLRVILQ